MNRNIYFSLLFIAFSLIHFSGKAQNINIGANNAGQITPIWTCAADGVTYTILDNVTVIGTLFDAPETISFIIGNNDITITWNAEITGSDNLINSVINITGASNTFIINGTIESNGTKGCAVETNGNVVVETNGIVTSTGSNGISVYAKNTGNTINVLGNVETIGYGGVAIKTEGANSAVIVTDGGNVNATCSGIAILTQGINSEVTVNQFCSVTTNCSGIGIKTDGNFSEVNIIGGMVLADNYSIYCTGNDNEVYINNDAMVISAVSFSVRTDGINSKVEVLSGEVGSIHTTGDNTDVSVFGGLPRNITTEGDNTTVNILGGEVMLIHSFGDDTTITVSDGTVAGIFTTGAENIVIVSGGVVRDTTGTAISATGLNNLVNVSGTGEVFTISGIAIYSTSTVIIEGGLVSAFEEYVGTTLLFGTAIKQEEASSTVLVSGGVVRATYGAAIESPGQVDVIGGIVFAYGDDIKGVGNVIVADTFTEATGTGIAIGWDKEKGNTVYCIYTETDLSKSPLTATAMWDIENGAGGIRFANGTNAGFIRIRGIIVKRVPTADDFDFLIIDKDYDCEPVDFQITAINGNPTFIVFFNGDQDNLPTNAGTYMITVNIIQTDLDSDFCLANDVYIGTLTINPAQLTVTALDATMIYGTNPDDVYIEYTIDGFVCDENESILTQSPSISIASDINSTTLPGVYPDKILVWGGITENYNFEYILGTLSIVSAEIIGITVNGHETIRDGNNFVFTDPQCGNNLATILVITEDPLATVIINEEQGNNLTFDLDIGSNIFIITVISQNGQIEDTYILTIERLVPFEQVVKIRWSDNTFTVINNSNNNGGFNFNSATFQWFFNDEPIIGGTGQSLSFDPHGATFTQGYYHVEISFSSSPGFLRSCQYYVSFGKMGLKIYPNPAVKGQTIYFETDMDTELLDDAVIEIYNYLGIRVTTINTQDKITPINLQFTPGVHFFILKCKNGFKKELKIIVQ